MLTIALLGDLHYFRLEDSHREDAELAAARRSFFDAYFRAFLDYPADLHISIGDLTHGGYPEEFEELYRLIRASGVRFRLVPGNHDAQSLPKARIAELVGHPAYGALEREEADLVFLDTAKEMQPTDWGGEMDETQLQWLEERIGRSGTKPMLVFAHHPVYDTTAGSTDKWFNIDPDSRIRSVLDAKRGRGFYFNGHNHVHSVASRGQWHYVQTAAGLCYPAFRAIELGNGRIAIRDVVLEHRDMAQSLDVLTARFACFYFTDRIKAAGAEADRNVAIEWP